MYLLHKDITGRFTKEATDSLEENHENIISECFQFYITKLSQRGVS